MMYDDGDEKGGFFDEPAVHIALSAGSLIVFLLFLVANHI